MASNSAITNAVISLLTPAAPGSTANQTVMTAESDAASALTTVAQTALLTVPFTQIPVLKQIIDGVISVIVNVIVSKVDDGVYDIIATVQNAHNAANVTADQASYNTNPNAANQAQLENDASNTISFVGSKPR